MQGGSTLVAFELEGGKARAFRFMNALRLIDISNNLGDSKSLITHPATTTHQRLKPEERAELGLIEPEPLTEGVDSLGCPVHERAQSAEKGPGSYDGGHGAVTESGGRLSPLTLPGKKVAAYRKHSVR